MATVISACGSSSVAGRRVARESRNPTVTGMIGVWRRLYLRLGRYLGRTMSCYLLASSGRSL